jgi:sulfur-oxidizing protein SoxX
MVNIFYIKRGLVMLRNIFLGRFVSILVMSAFFLATSHSVNADEKGVSVQRGKEIFHTRGQPKFLGHVIGNCTACHWVEDKELTEGDQPGNMGPALIGMKARFPDEKKLFKQIWDASESNPNSVMPPFGKNGIMSKEDVLSVVKYLYTL